MNVEPAAQILERVPIYDPSATPLPVKSGVGVQGSAPPPAALGQPGAGSLSAIEQQFVQLVNTLTQQLTGLEQQLAQALQVLGGTNAGAPCDTGGCPGSAPSGPPRFHRYGNLINDAARKHEIDPLLVGAVIRHESGFMPAAVSKTGAMGLMQLMPQTAKALGVRDAFDPRQNIEGGTTLLRQLLDRYNGHVDLALAAYNAGPAAVDKYGGIPPYRETQAYVRNVMESYRESALST